MNLSTDPALFEIQDLSVVYLTSRGAARAVDGVSLTVKPGEVVGLAGESGSGKSTIAQAVLRILHPPALITGGKAIFNGKDILEMNEQELEHFRWKNVSMVFQCAMNSLNPVMRIRDQLMDVMLCHGLSKTQVSQRSRELFELVGIDPGRLDAYPHQLSGGMRQRAVIAIALALNPQLLILDEPTTALDVVVQKDILQRIADLQAKLGFSILFITHDLSLLVETASDIAIMYAGEIVEKAPARELFESPLHPYTLGLMNSFPSIRGKKREFSGIPGSAPDLVNPPSGCRFHPRCNRCMPVCPEVAPRLTQVTEGHWVSCHLYMRENAPF